MYRCSHCGRSFAAFTTPGKCPLCGMWGNVKCDSCGLVDSAEVFAKNYNNCPRCGRKVRAEGSTNQGFYMCPRCGNRGISLTRCEYCGRLRWFYVTIFLLSTLIATLFLVGVLTSSGSMKPGEMISMALLLFALGPASFVLILYFAFFKRSKLRTWGARTDIRPKGE